MSNDRRFARFNNKEENHFVTGVSRLAKCCRLNHRHNVSYQTARPKLNRSENSNYTSNDSHLESEQQFN